MSRRVALGVRGRLVLVVAVTAVASLALAAVLLLGPLEKRLRDNELAAVDASAVASTSSFDRLPARDLHPGSPALRDLARLLRHRVGGQVAVVTASGQLLTATDPDPIQRFDDATAVARDRRPLRTIAPSPDGGGDEARVALPIQPGGMPLALAVEKSLRDTRTATHVVSSAFTVAALISLVFALVAGVLVASRFTSRLRGLREVALSLPSLSPTAELPHDASPDEIGDVHRAFESMQERVGEQERARRTFVSTASHELRTPLASLDLQLRLAGDELMRTDPDLDEVRREVGRAQAQTERLTRLAGDLLDLSRVDAGVPLRTELVSLGEIARTVASEFALPAGERDVDLQLETGDHDTWVRGDPGAIVRIARILLDNAIAVSPPGTAATVAVGADGDGGTLSVRDEGPGVDPGEREVIFQRFRRGAASNDGGGFGLGLAIGRELAERMGGELDLDGGPGTCFRLRLPRAHPSARPDSTVPVSP